MPSLAPFRPADFAPPSEQSAQPGDGEWKPWPTPLDGDLGPLLYRTTVHPHQASRFIQMDVVAIDLRRLRVHWVPGSKDEYAERLRDHAVPGLIPPEHREDTVAVFNGGFLARHGRWGVVAHGLTLQEPKPEGCILALRGTPGAPPGDPGPVLIGTWRENEDRAAEFRMIRQTPPCLLEDGVVHSRLVSGSTRPWAGQNKERKTRRRSAVGIDESGWTLFYAVGTETEAVHLARGMHAVGALHALQLDINWSWTRFLLPATREDGQRRIAHTLISEMAFAKNEYFGWPSERDFFYLVLAVHP